MIFVALREGMAGHGFRDVAGIDVTVASQVDTQRIGPIWTDLDQFGPIWTNLDLGQGDLDQFGQETTRLSQTHQQQQLASVKKGTNEAKLASIDAD